MATVHELSLAKAVLVTLVPGLLLFGYGFGGIGAAEMLGGLDLVGLPPERAG